MRKVSIRYSLLLDYYGALLPKKQYDIAVLYHNDDLSLSEIAQELGITRQGVRDALERAEASLDAYEEALLLVQKDQTIRRAADELRLEVQKLEALGNTDTARKISAICDTIAPKG